MSTKTTIHLAPTPAPHLSKWLESSRKWDIEYGGYLSNHITHVWVILGVLNYPESRFKAWQDLYTSSEAAHVGEALEPAREPLPNFPTITDDNYLKHITPIPTHYPSYLNYFDSKLKSPKDVPQVIKKHLPPLLPGLAGAALHPVIQAGWGAEVKNPKMVAEGLAYMSTAFQPLSTPETLWTDKDDDGDSSGPVDLALKYLTLSNDEDLTEKARKASTQPHYESLKRGGFQTRMMTFDDKKLSLGKALNSVGPLTLPALGKSLMPAVNECIALAATALLGSDGEFFVIHGATSLLGVLAMIEHLEERHQREALACWWRAAMAAITVQNLPGLQKTVEIIEHWKSSDGRLVKEDGGVMKVDEEWWKRTLDRSLKSYDEHVPKAVYAMWRWVQLKGLSDATRDICRKVAERLGRENEEGLMHKNFWMQTFDQEPDYNELASEGRKVSLGKESK